MKVFVLPMSLALLLVCQKAAEAITMTNLTTNTVLFQDNFEGLSSVSGSPAIDASDVYHPVAQIGSYQIYDTGSAVQVTNSTSSPDPGPYQGSNYLRLYRDSTSGNETDGLMLQNYADADMIQLRTMVYIPTSRNVANSFQMVMTGSGTTNPEGVDLSLAAAWIRPNGAGKVQFVGPNFAVTTTNISYTAGVWQEWDINYAINAGTYTFTVGGVTSGNINSTSGFSGVDGFMILNGSPTAGSVYFDAVKPPIIFGDFNRDGHVNAQDISVEMQALTNTASYMAGHDLSSNSDLLSVGDINHDGAFNNADLQSFLNYLKAGNGSTAVPEPASLVLFGTGILGLAVMARRRKW